jgi:hypothetical protein
MVVNLRLSMLLRQFGFCTMVAELQSRVSPEIFPEIGKKKRPEYAKTDA